MTFSHYHGRVGDMVPNLNIAVSAPGVKSSGSSPVVERGESAGWRPL